MTNEQLWNRLEKALKTKSLIWRAFKITVWLKLGYEQDLDMLVAGQLRNNDPETLRLGYIDADDFGGKLMMCYTSWKHAHKEWKTGDTNDILFGSTAFSIRASIDNIFNKKSIIGIVFNPEEEDSILIIPKETLEALIPEAKP